MKELERFYHLLEIHPGASLEEINQAYKDLVFIWHPDRLPKDNPRLLQKAEAKLKALNHAREQLRLLQQGDSPHMNHTSTSHNTPQQYHHHPGRPFYKDFIGADLRRANFKEKDLSGRNLTQGDLSYADLSDSFLHKVILEKANLYKANLFRANLLQANLREANLEEANLIGADLSGVDLTRANLSGAKVKLGGRIMVKLTGAILSEAILPW